LLVHVETLFAMTTQASDRVASPQDVLDLLDEVAQALDELASACEEAGHSLVPRPRGTASDWRFSPGPLSHQQKILALSTLHNLGAAVRTAARRSRDAHATLRPVTECLLREAAEQTPRPTARTNSEG
jgi:hypothetical protein